jgi:16S rRNA (adenine1518-N6/adenine1519-N6)-dimethyltransferase
MPARPRARKRYGQHFLEPAWADKLVAAIDPRPEDRFLEIGPGAGALTVRLAPAVAHLVAVEIDANLVAELRGRVPGNVTLVHGDFLEFDLVDVAREGPLRVAGNLPYNISSPILFKLLRDHRNTGRLRDATLMLQREVAERIEAVPGTKDYGVLSILVGLDADVRHVLTLPPGAFRPAPKVQSAVVRLDFREPEITLDDRVLFEQMVRTIFTQRRKTLLNALRPLADSRRVDPRQALQSAAIDGSRRPETLDLPELARLANTINQASRSAN